MNNDGIVYSVGTVNNAGTLISSATGIIYNGVCAAGEEGCVVGGTLNNNTDGTLTFQLGTIFDNTYGTLNNNAGGRIESYVDNFYANVVAVGTVNLGRFSTFANYAVMTSSSVLTNVATIENNGTLASTATGTINNAGTFNLNGGILNVDTFNGDLNNTGGTVGPGHSPGITTINGDYSQDANSMLLIEILGMTSGTEYDVLNVTGSATLGGVLNIDLDYAGLALGDSFDILIADAILGEFASISNGSINEHWIWTLDYDLDGSNTVTASVSAVPLPAAAWLFMSDCRVGRREASVAV